jgi:hypothetical protein
VEKIKYLFKWSSSLSGEDRFFLGIARASLAMLFLAAIILVAATHPGIPGWVGPTALAMWLGLVAWAFEPVLWE